MQSSHSCHTPCKYPVQAAHQNLLAATGTNSPRMYSNTQTPDSAGGGTVITSPLTVLHLQYRKVSCSCYAVKMISPSKLLETISVGTHTTFLIGAPSILQDSLWSALHLISLSCISEQVMLNISKTWCKDFCAKVVSL